MHCFSAALQSFLQVSTASRQHCLHASSSPQFRLQSRAVVAEKAAEANRNVNAKKNHKACFTASPSTRDDEMCPPTVPGPESQGWHPHPALRGTLSRLRERDGEAGVRDGARGCVTSIRSRRCRQRTFSRRALSPSSRTCSWAQACRCPAAATCTPPTRRPSARPPCGSPRRRSCRWRL